MRSAHVTPEPISAAPAEAADRRQSSPGRHRVARDGSSGAPEPARQPWFTPALLGVFASGAGAALVLAGSEVAVVAQLRNLGHLTFTGAVFVVWGVTSIIGGFVYGALRREFSPPVVLLGLSVLTLPIGLANGPVGVALLVGVAGLFCAPALTATSTALTHLVAEESRGEALGWQGAAMTAGSGLGAPLAGFAADHGGAAAGYLAAGAVGAGLALIALALTSAYRPKGDSGPAGTEAARNTGARVPADTLTD